MNGISLFSGCLGLDLGLESVGIDLGCYVENDRDCLRLIADRRPSARVIEDVKLVDAELAAEFGEVEALAGGFPCQDLSYAGRGAGLDGDRSGLWFEMIRIVRDIQPRLVLVENVPGLLTRGIHVVVHDLARAGYIGRWFTLGAVEVGAPHRRERVFILARRADVSHVEPLLGGHPSGLFQADGWFSPQESLFDSAPLLRLGKRGRWTLDSVYEDDARLALDDDDDATLLPTPNSSESTPTEDFLDEIRDADLRADARLYLPGRKHHVQRTLSRVVPLMDQVDAVALLPTPGAHDANGGEGETRKVRQEDGSTGGASLRDLPHLLPTPCHSDWRGKSGPNADSPESRLANVEMLLPTPAARDGKGGNPNEREGGDDLPTVAEKLLPTPVAGDAKAGGSRNLPGSKAHAGVSLTDVIQTGDSTTPRLLPTPTAEDGERGRNGSGADRLGAGTFDELQLLPTPVANPDNPGAGGELRAAITHGPGRRNETGIDSMGRPNDGRPSRLLPTPQGADGHGGRMERGAMARGGKRPSGHKATLPLPTAVELREEIGESPFAEAEATEQLLPTPQAADGDRASEQGPRYYAGGGDNPTLLGAAKRTTTSWGVYEAAIRRWEDILGREAPTPTDEKGRLAPEFVEWMLGYGDAWTLLAGISRTARLRMLGNSVQVQVGARVGLALLALDRSLAKPSQIGCA